MLLSRYKLSLPVQKRLKAKNLTAENVIRKALGMDEGWTSTDGAYFPNDTVFMKRLPYKGRMCGAVVKDGKLMIENKSFTSLSAAAAHYTGLETTNGWGWFDVRFAGEEKWLPASKFKPKSSSKAAA